MSLAASRYFLPCAGISLIPSCRPCDGLPLSRGQRPARSPATGAPATVVSVLVGRELAPCHVARPRGRAAPRSLSDDLDSHRARGSLDLARCGVDVIRVEVG